MADDKKVCELYKYNLESTETSLNKCLAGDTCEKSAYDDKVLVFGGAGIALVVGFLLGAASHH